MCIRDSLNAAEMPLLQALDAHRLPQPEVAGDDLRRFQRTDQGAGEDTGEPVSYTHLRAHETVLDLVCRLLLENKHNTISETSTSVMNSTSVTTDDPPDNHRYTTQQSAKT